MVYIKVLISRCRHCLYWLRCIKVFVIWWFSLCEYIFISGYILIINNSLLLYLLLTHPPLIINRYSILTISWYDNIPWSRGRSWYWSYCGIVICMYKSRLSYCVVVIYAVIVWYVFVYYYCLVIVIVITCVYWLLIMYLLWWWYYDWPSYSILWPFIIPIYIVTLHNNLIGC